MKMEGTESVECPRRDACVTMTTELDSAAAAGRNMCE